MILTGRRRRAIGRARRWLVDAGADPRRIRAMTPRQVRQEIDATFTPSGFRGFVRYVQPQRAIVPDFAGRERPRERPSDPPTTAVR